MFASTGTCCEGLKSTYQTVVGRSRSLWGPYVDRLGKSMMDNHHELLIGRNERFLGTGHNAELVMDDMGHDWILYHGIDTTNPHGRVLLLDRVEWKDGWPAVQNSSPSEDSECPIFLSDRLRTVLSLKVPGNKAINYSLQCNKLMDCYFDYEWKSDYRLPVLIFQKVETDGGKMLLKTQITALQDVFSILANIYILDFRMTSVCFICRDFGTGVISDHRKKLLHSIPLIVGSYVRIVLVHR